MNQNLNNISTRKQEKLKKYHPKNSQYRETSESEYEYFILKIFCLRFSLTYKSIALKRFNKIEIKNVMVHEEIIFF